MNDAADTVEISRPLLRGLVAQLERGETPSEALLVLKHVLQRGRRPNASEMIAGAATSGESQLSALKYIAATYQERRKS
jgi:hypothetical protein